MSVPLDPALLARIAPTELAPGEDPIARFRREVEAVSGVVTVTARGGVVDALESAVMEHWPGRVTLAADLDAYRDPLRERLVPRGIDADDYEVVARDRARAEATDVAVTGCVAAVAGTGSILTGGASGRGGALVAPHHVCLVESRRLFGGLLSLLRALPRIGAASGMALQSGPSRTADIEKTLILGMHGPKTVHVVVVDDGAPPDEAS
ncbi:MAG: LUD domain-containing protein [Thermoleophilia bacterium]|nr:LUD domain-containing protein [Thermoleophilia bacterium]